MRFEFIAIRFEISARKGVTDMQISSHRAQAAVLALVVAFFSLAPIAVGQNVTYKPYIQPGDNGPFGAKDQMVVAWQTDESSPNPGAFTVQFGRVPHPCRCCKGAGFDFSSATLRLHSNAFLD